MPRKPTLSPTKLSAYLVCRTLFRYTYVHPQRAFLKAKSYYSFGSTLHRVLERFYREPDRGVDPRESLQELYDESWIDAGYQSAEEMADAFAEGKTLLERVAEEITLGPSPARTIAVEKTVRMDFGEFQLVGRLDRLDEHPDGTLEIIDYKSGRSLIDAESLRSDLALSCYQLLVRQHYPDRKRRVTLVDLRSLERYSASLSDEELDELQFDVGELGRQLLNHDWYEIRPTPKPFCPRCDFLPLCRRDPEFSGRSEPDPFADEPT